MLEGRKYVIGENAGIISGVAKLPEGLAYPHDDYKSTGEAVGLLIHMADVETDPVICMTYEEAKYFVKALKIVMKEYKRRNRRKQ